MQPLLVLAGAAILALSACDSGSSPPSGDQDTGGGDTAGGDAGGDAAGGDTDSTSTGAVTWSSIHDNPTVLNLTTDIGADYFLQYDVVLPDPNDPPAFLYIVLCSTPAGEATDCVEIRNEVAVAGPGGYRWGVDPSQYNPGFNVFEHTASLRRNLSTLTESTLRFEVTR